MKNFIIKFKKKGSENSLPFLINLSIAYRNEVASMAGFGKVIPPKFTCGGE
jgi:hypothetical protein